MIWHIAKRELYDNLNSLRFALATVLLLALMLTNAIVHLREYPAQIQKYRTSVTATRNALTAQTNLYDIAQRGPGWLYKKPSSLQFCVDGGEALLSNAVEGSHGLETDDLKSFWRLTYPSAAPNLKNVRPDVTKVDWGFVIGYVLSLTALLFTFDSISGEREQGTLRLMLANPMSRHTVLIGKFFGALISINLPFTLTVLINLLVISMSSDVHLSAMAWERLGIIFFIALLYTCSFIALGLLVSARVRQSAVSLVILLLIWVTFVVFMPRTLASIASEFSSSMTSDELWKRHSQLNDELWNKYSPQLWSMLARSEFVTKDVQQKERLYQEHLTQQIVQVHLARSITCISPAAIVQHLLESFAGTGFNRHLQFLENVRHYARKYRAFVVETDRADPESLHLIGVRGGMSQRKVPVEAIPIFEDTHSLNQDFNAAATNLLLLLLFFVVLFSCAHFAFVRVDV